MRLFSAIGAGLLLLATPVLADDLPIAPPTAPVNPLDVKPTSHGAFARSFAFGAYKGALGKTGLAGIPDKLGTGRIQHLGNGREVPDWICYDLSAQHQRVWLTSADHDEAGVVGQVTIKALTAADAASATCAVLPAKFQPLLVDSALHIGMSKADLIKVMGAPARQVDAWLVFRGEGRDGSDKVTNGLSAKVENDRVVFLSVFTSAHTGD